LIFPGWISFFSCVFDLSGAEFHFSRAYLIFQARIWVFWCRIPSLRRGFGFSGAEFHLPGADLIFPGWISSFSCASDLSGAEFHFPGAHLIFQGRIWVFRC